MIALVAACATLPDDPGYLRVRGSLEDGIALGGTDQELAVVWVIAVGGETCVAVDPVDFAPELLGYRADIAAPPSVDVDPCVPTPDELVPRGPFAVGLLALLDPTPGSEVELAADPRGLLGWLAGDDGTAADQLVARGGTLAAVADGFALMVVAEEPPDGAAYCRFDGALPGLVLYTDEGPGCGGWTPVAEAGTRTEVQGVDLAPP